MNDYSRIYYKTISIYYLKLSTSKELYVGILTYNSLAR